VSSIKSLLFKSIKLTSNSSMMFLEEFIKTRLPLDLQKYRSQAKDVSRFFLRGKS